MNCQFVMTQAPIDDRALLAERAVSGSMGAAVYFLGIVRQTEDGVPIRFLEYEVFAPMAEHQVGLLFQELERRWPIESVRLVHRVGVVPVNEAALWVEVIAPHRGEAFTACQWLIDELKRVVPIWKHARP